MNAKGVGKYAIALTAAVSLIIALTLVAQPQSLVRGDGVLSLRAPSFVRASTGESTIASSASYLEDEAGIAAYTQVSGPIDLAGVRGTFRAIERETDQYIIGSVGIPDYSEDHDPHVYVHSDGWVVAYYLAAEAAAYIIDAVHYDSTEMGTTKLEDAIYEVLLSIGITSFESTYYDFRHPNATNIMLIAEAIDEKGSESFNVQLPDGFTYYDRSWLHAFYVDYKNDSSDLSLDDVSLNAFDPGYEDQSEWMFARGYLTTAQLAPNVSHTIELYLSDSSCDAVAGMALVYQEVP